MKYFIAARMSIFTFYCQNKLKLLIKLKSDRLRFCYFKGCSRTEKATNKAASEQLRETTAALVSGFLFSYQEENLL
jgi:hypothetical protein